MFSDPSRIADAINNPRFHSGDQVILAEGPHKYTRGTFLSLREDVEWANVRESSGVLSMHPVEWLRADDPDRKVERARRSEESDTMKQLSVTGVPATEKFGTAPGDRFSPRQDAIATLAHGFWKGRGSPLGSPEEDWFRAEREIEHHRTPGSVV